MRKVIGAALFMLIPLALSAEEGVAPVGTAPLPTAADAPKPWGSRDFTFHRVAVPKAGERGRIVQIDPGEEPYFLTPALPPGTTARHARPRGPVEEAPADWFWAGVSSSIAASNPGRLDQALEQLRLARSTIAPRTESVSRLVTQYGPRATETARGTRVSPALVLAVMSVESGGRPEARSKAGAEGLMQLMPGTAKRYGVKNALDPDQNIAGGVAYLDFLLRAFGEDPILAIAAYNAGEGAVAQNKGVPPYSETRRYVPKVLGAWTVARLFCRIPPRLVTDPCEFNTMTASEGTPRNG